MGMRFRFTGGIGTRRSSRADSQRGASEFY
jgi:hypothetical protein